MLIRKIKFLSLVVIFSLSAFSMESKDLQMEDAVSGEEEAYSDKEQVFLEVEAQSRGYSHLSR